MKSLIVYFSKRGENYFQGKIRSLEKGNTERVAEKISEITHAEMFEIETEKAYPDNYDLCVRVAHEELSNKIKPKLQGYPEHMNEVDVIYLGYPNWWGTMPMPVVSFLEKFNFQGKTIFPFSTSEGSSISKSIEDIKRICPDANVKEGLLIEGSEVKSSDLKIEAWLRNK